MSDGNRDVTSDLRFALIPDWILDGRASSRAVLVYAQLALFADYDSGECYARRKTIADRLHVSTSTVDRGLDELAALDAVTIVERYADDRSRLANAFVVHRIPPSSRMTTGSADLLSGSCADQRRGPSSDLTTQERDLDERDLLNESAVELRASAVDRARAKADESGAALLVDLLVTYLQRDDVRHSITAAWYDQMRLLVERDERDFADVGIVLRWVFETEKPRGDWPGWRANVHSPAALRRHFDKIRAQMQRDGAQREPAGFEALRREAQRTGAT